jgi:AcrR family transcriptional regulator
MDSTPDSGINGGRAAERCTRWTQGARCTHVIEAAIRLFGQQGFQGTKTREIADAAGINEALIFRDFGNKENLYCAILDYASSRINTQQWIEELEPYAGERCDEAVFSNLARKILESFGREHTLYRLMLYSALEQHDLARKFRERQIEPVQRFIQDYVQSRQADGAFRCADARALAWSFLSLCHHHVLRHILFGDPLSNADAVNTFTQVFLNGVRSR